MANKKIGIDIDDTVADYMAGAIPMMKELFGLEPINTANANTIEDAFGFSTKNLAPENKWQYLGFSPRTQEEIKQMRYAMYVEGRLFRTLPLLEECVQFLTHELTELGFKIYFITARSPFPEIVEDTHFWLKCHNFFYNDVFFTDEKIKLCQLASIPILLDDQPKNAREAIHGGIKIILRDNLWNRGLDNEYPTKILNRVSTWREVPKIAEDLLK